MCAIHVYMPMATIPPQLRVLALFTLSYNRTPRSECSQVRVYCESIVSLTFSTWHRNILNILVHFLTAIPEGTSESDISRVPTNGVMYHERPLYLECNPGAYGVHMVRYTHELEKTEIVQAFKSLITQTDFTTEY